MSSASETSMPTKPISCRATGRAALKLLLASAVASSACAGGLPIGSTPGEVALLPAYCMDTSSFGYDIASSNPSPRAGHWVGLMGKSFWHMHHYCYGLIKARRATLPGAGATHRKFMLETAINEFDYVIVNSPADFIMLPEVYLRRGDAELQLGKVVAARESFDLATKVKPDFAPAYSHWADELENGASYEVALTTAGGLYRYRLGDRVRVTGFMDRTPCLRFLGRGDRVVDLCGEKLDEAFVAECLAQVVGRSVPLAFLAPDSHNGIQAYTLYFSGEVMPGLMSRLEATLSTNPHYRLARRLGQLGKPRLFQIFGDAERVYVNHLAATTMCLGAIKPTALHHLPGWSQRFAGSYQTMEEG